MAATNANADGLPAKLQRAAAESRCAQPLAATQQAVPQPIRARILPSSRWAGHGRCAPCPIYATSSSHACV